MKIVKLLIAVTILSSASLTWADLPQWSQKPLPFDQSMDMNVVYEVTTAKPANLIKTINKYGVRVLLVKSLNPEKELNPILSKLEVASVDLLKKAEFLDSYEGRLIVKEDSCCDVLQDTVLIRDTALTYTLIHEFLHSVLRSKQGLVDSTLESRFASAHRKVLFFQKKLFMDPYLMLQANWRRDILQANQDVIEMMHARMQMGQSQEAIIENILSKYIDEKNPYYDKGRKERGYQYGESMINNMIDIYNGTDYSLSWSRNTVSGLREAILSGDLEKSEEKNLSEKEAAQFADEIKKTLEKLKPLKAEILKIKEFYTK